MFFGVESWVSQTGQLVVYCMYCRSDCDARAGEPVLALEGVTSHFVKCQIVRTASTRPL